MKVMVSLLVLMLLAEACFAMQKETFPHVKIHRHRNRTHREFIDRVGVLTFDDDKRVFTFEKTREDRFDPPEQIDAAYDSVVKIVCEVTTHMRGGLVPVPMMVTLPTAIAAVILAGQHVHDYWFYCKYKIGDQTQALLL